MDREKGAASLACPTCGTELGSVVNADGSVAAKTCPKCYAAPAPAAPEVARLVPPTLPRREQGSDPEQSGGEL